MLKGTKRREKRKKTIFDYLHTILIILIILVIPIFLYEAYKYKAAVDEYNSIPEMSDVPATENMEILEVPPQEWPDDRFFVEKGRADFRSGDLRLVIPRMEVDDDVMDGTDMAALKHGPGLYTVAQMPGSDRRSNTSIAGHRSGHGRYGNIFKQIHTVKDGDLLYLTDKEWVYVYLYQSTIITDPDDVSVLYIKDYPCMTLTSCNPIGKNTERIILDAKLVSIQPYSEDFVYKESAEGEELERYRAME